MHALENVCTVNQDYKYPFCLLRKWGKGKLFANLVHLFIASKINKQEYETLTLSRERLQLSGFPNSEISLLFPQFLSNRTQKLKVKNFSSDLIFPSGFPATKHKVKVKSEPF